MFFSPFKIGLFYVLFHFCVRVCVGKVNFYKYKFKLCLCFKQGFRKIESWDVGFANEKVVIGEKHFLKNIHRCRPAHSHYMQNQDHVSIPLTKQKNSILRWKLIDNHLLHLDLQRHQREGDIWVSITTLGENLWNMEQKTSNMTLLIGCGNYGILCLFTTRSKLNCFTDINGVWLYLFVVVIMAISTWCKWWQLYTRYSCFYWFNFVTFVHRWKSNL